MEESASLVLAENIKYWIINCVEYFKQYYTVYKNFAA